MASVNAERPYPEMVGWFANDCASHAIAANGISVRMRCRHRVNPDGGAMDEAVEGAGAVDIGELRE
jgi:hypothetical protein